MSGQATLGKVDGIVRAGRRHGRYLWMVGLALYIGIIWYVGWHDVKETLLQIDYRFIAALMLVEVAGLALRAYKWRLALGPAQQSLRACFISKAGGNLTPGRVGEFSPLLFSEHRNARIGAWIILDRVLEACATLVVGIVGLLAVVGIAGSVRLLALSVLLLCGMAIALYLLSDERFAIAIEKRLRKLSRLKQIAHWPRELGAELRRLRAKAPVLGLLSFVATGIDLVVAYLLYLSFGFSVALMVLAFTQVVHALATVFPLTPNATGVPYVAAAGILHHFAGLPVDVLALAVGVRLLAGTAVFWGMFALAMSGKKQESPPVQSEWASGPQSAETGK